MVWATARGCGAGGPPPVPVTETDPPVAGADSRTIVLRRMHFLHTSSHPPRSARPNILAPCAAASPLCPPLRDRLCGGSCPPCAVDARAAVPRLSLRFRHAEGAGGFSPTSGKMCGVYRGAVDGRSMSRASSRHSLAARARAAPPQASQLHRRRKRRTRPLSHAPRSARQLTRAQHAPHVRGAVPGAAPRRLQPR